MLCGGCSSKKRPRLEEEFISLEEYQLMEKEHHLERESLVKELAKMTLENKGVETRLEKLEKIVLAQAEMLNDRQSFSEKVTYLDNKYAKKLDDLTAAQKECAKNTADVLKLVAACTKYYDTSFKDLPDDVQAECHRLEKLTGHDWFQFAIALGIPKKIVEERRGSNNTESFWNVIQFRQSMEPLKVQQLHDAFSKVRKPGIKEVYQMPVIHIEIVNACKRELYTEVIDVVIALPYMRCYTYISPEVVKHIILPDATITRMSNMIDTLPIFGHEALPLFRNALHHSGHEAVASKITDMAQKQGASIGNPVPLPLDEKDRLYLRRKSRIIASQRVADEVNEIREMLRKKAEQQISESEEATTRL